MTPPTRENPDEPEASELQYQHPTGTLALVGIMGLLYVLGWAAFYFLLYLGRGPLLP